MDFIAIDFEIANNNLNSACSLGMILVKENKIVDEKYFLIQPPSLVFDEKMAKVHGLSKDDVLNAPKFDVIWGEIKHYFQPGTLVIAHNAQFDMSVLKSCLLEYSLEVPNIQYACSISISSPFCREAGVRGSLKARTQHFGIVLEHHHHALQDAKACAELVMKSVELSNHQSIESMLASFGESISVRNLTQFKHQDSFYRKKPQRFKNVDIKNITPSCDEMDCNHPFYEKNMVFTGELSMMERGAAMQKVVDAGGIIKSSVSRKTDYLVVGRQDKALVGEKGISTKEEKANSLIEKGFDIKIINEIEFFELLDSSNKISS